MTDPAEILKPICSRDETRPNITEPFGMDYEGRRWAAATDGHMLVAVVCDGYPLRKKAPDVTTVLRPEPPLHAVSAAPLRKWAGPVPVPSPTREPQMVECDECDGTGEAVCHSCDRDGARCWECGGTGKLRENTTPKIEIRCGALLAGVLDRVLLARVLATLPDDVTELRVGQKEELTPYVLRAPDWIAAIMPVRGGETKSRFKVAVAA